MSQAVKSASSRREYLYRLACRDRRLDGIWNGSSPAHFLLNPFCVHHAEDAGGAEPTASASSPMDTTLGRLGRLLDKEDASLPSHSRQLPLITNVTEQPAAVEELPSAERVSFLDSSQSLAADASKVGRSSSRFIHTLQCDQTEGWGTRHNRGSNPHGVCCMSGRLIKLFAA